MTDKIVLLSGGVGGAKLALGLQSILQAGALTVIANTGDDFDHLGLKICPDIDTLLYTLAGCANPDRGWGRSDETWSFMKAFKSIGGEDWFNLGDGDLALHVRRTGALQHGVSLSRFTAEVAQYWGIASKILPMSDDTVATRILTPTGEIAFQEYFVRRRCEPTVVGLRFAGAEDARLSDELITALHAPDLSAIIIAPSNPYLSIDPILAVPGMISALRTTGVPVVAVSPIIGRTAVKGPTAKIMENWSIVPSALVIATHYAEVIDGCLIDVQDEALVPDFPIRVATADILMQSLEDRKRVALAALDLARRIAMDRSRT